MKILVLLTSIIFPFILNAQIIQNLGLHRDGKFYEKELLTEWPEQGPELILQIENIGKGWSAAVATSDKIFVTGLTDTIDFISAYNFEGELLWRSPFGRSWMNTFPDTRSTPTIEGNKVWVLSGTGNLCCFNIEDGAEIWSVNVDQKFNAIWDIWGVAESPLIVDNMVITVPAGNQTAMVALDKNTGNTIWETQKLSGNRSYVSPVIYEHDGVRLILGMTTEVFFAVNPTNGNVVWEFPFRNRGNELENNKNQWPIYANCPIIIGDKILVTAGWDFGSILFEVASDGKSLKELWVNRTLDTQQHGVVEHNGYLYGSNWLNMKKGNWVCVDFESGETKWETEHHNKGIVISADEMLYLYDEEGNISLVQPSSDQLKIISEFKIESGTGQHWAHPFIDKGKLFIRHGNTLNVYNISNN